MHQEIYEELKQKARERNTTYYSEIAPLAGLDMSNPDHRRRLGQILGDISTHEHEAGRPLLSAVAVGKDTNRPRNGFFKLARELNLIRASDDEDSFFIEELNKVYEAWR